MADIENTTAIEPIVHLGGMLGGDTERYITGMEAAGQRQLVASNYLPTEGDWAALEALGFVRGAEKRGDELFTEVTLPDGWRKETTDHDMHSSVLDERGVKRVGVFYKAAFYDRRASFHIVHVGYEIASTIAEAQTLPVYWPNLTDDEKRSAREALADSVERDRGYAERETSDDYWSKAVAKGQSALRLIDGELAGGGATS